MSLRIRWASHAKAEFAEIIEFNASRGERFAEELANAVLDRIEALATLPLTAPPWRLAPDASYRRLVIREVVVIYRHVEEQGALYILSVRHGRQKPAAVVDVATANDDLGRKP